MKGKNNVLFAVGYGILLVVVNILLFSSFQEKDSHFWSGYGFTMLSLLVPLGVFLAVCGKSPKLKTMLFGMSVIMVSCVYTLLQFAVGIIVISAKGMNLTAINVLQIVILGAYLIIVIAAAIGKKVITDIDEKQDRKVSYITSIVDDIADMLDAARDVKLQKKLTSLSEVAVYSDPMSHESLEGLEQQIVSSVQRLSGVVAQQNVSDALQMCDEIEKLFGQRNRRCKSLK